MAGNRELEESFMWADFRKFVLKGNVIDLAVAVVIGVAFGAIVSSIVKDIIMPVIGYLTAGISFSDLKVVLAAAVGDTPEVAITYGNLLQLILQFIIIALTIFLIVRGLGKLRKKQEEQPTEPPAKPDDVLLLEEIRDLLKK
jgi:large conductance mechanosensitive channel